VSGVVDPALGRPLGPSRMLQEVTASGPEVAVRIELPTPAYLPSDRAALERAVTEAVRRARSETGSVRVSFTAAVRGKNAGGRVGLNVKNIVSVGSGKGGVGKSTVAASLAFGLKELGCKVGLMDADVYGPSIPHMTGVDREQPMATKVQKPDGSTADRIIPIEVDGLKVMSMGFFLKPDQAVIWRGPLLHRAITQFLADTEWGELDYLIIDLPPGTGDVSLTLSQLLGLAGAIVVCTPQKVALLDAVKAVSMYNQVKIPLLGIVENMTGEIFGRGGAKAKAEELGIPFLGEIPIDASVRIQADAGQIGSLFAADSPVRPQLLHICEQAALEIARQFVEAPALPSLEIL
jgi:ATP-binding protein involved in chromosome partitioning